MNAFNVLVTNSCANQGVAKSLPSIKLKWDSIQLAVDRLFLNAIVDHCIHVTL